VLFAITIFVAPAVPVSSWAQNKKSDGGGGQSSLEGGNWEHFSLIKGHGVSVCDAYLQLLNRAQFDVTPFCGRPDPDSGAGFTHLARQVWGADQILAMYTNVYEFMLYDNQFHIDRWFAPDPSNPNKRSMTTSPVNRGDVAVEMRLNRIRVWSYEEPIDIENDGTPLKVLVWQGDAAVGLSGGAGRCGADYGDDPWTVSYVNQQAFILNSDEKTIDERRTRAIFGAPEESSPARLTRRPLTIPLRGANPFEPLAGSIGIFEYRGRYYIDVENRPKTKDGALRPLEVYLREHNHIAKVCAYQPINVPGPEG
jgi:hypothetical protein